MSFMIKLSESSRKTTFTILRKSLFLLPLFFLLLFFSCRKSPHTLGASILPENAQLKIVYGFWDGLYGHSVLEDSIRTDELLRNMLGSRYDSVFGVTTANIAAQFSLTKSGVSFGENPMLDSMVLYLRYNGEIYGDSSTVQQLHIYELNQDIYVDSAYSSKSTFTHNDFDYANLSYTPAIHDSVVLGEGVFADTLPPQMVINLSNLSPDLGQKILDADTTVLESDSTFREYFKGLFFQSEPVTSNGALFTVNFLLSGSQIILYYHNDEKDSLQYRLSANAITARINSYLHDYSTSPADFKQQVLDGDTTLGFEKLYVQGADGIKTILRVPDIRDYTDSSKVAFNEVKLIIPGVGKPAIAPERLALVKIVGDSTYAPLIDQYEGESYFGGRYNSSSNEYVFRITRYMQSLYTGDQPNNGLYLFVSGASVNPESFVIKGNKYEGDTTGMRLEIIYTNLDDAN